MLRGFKHMVTFSITTRHGTAVSFTQEPPTSHPSRPRRYTQNLGRRITAFNSKPRIPCNVFVPVDHIRPALRRSRLSAGRADDPSTRFGPLSTEKRHGSLGTCRRTCWRLPNPGRWQRRRDMEVEEPEENPASSSSTASICGMEKFCAPGKTVNECLGIASRRVTRWMSGALLKSGDCK